MKMTNTDGKKIKQTREGTYVPVKKLIFEDNKKEVNVVNNFTDYSHVLASVEMIIHSFVMANPETQDEDILNALKRVRKNPLHEFSRSEENSLACAVVYGMSRSLQQKRLAINEVYALLDWLIHEVRGRMQRKQSYIKWLKEFFNEGLKKEKAVNKR